MGDRPARAYLAAGGGSLDVIGGGTRGQVMLLIRKRGDIGQGAELDRTRSNNTASPSRPPLGRLAGRALPFRCRVADMRAISTG
jgi:hypothetical protein